MLLIKTEDDEFKTEGKVLSLGLVSSKRDRRQKTEDRRHTTETADW